MYFVACQSHTCAKELETRILSIFSVAQIYIFVINISGLARGFSALTASITDKPYYRRIQRKFKRI